MRQPTGDDTLAGYVRQSIADIVPTATLRAAPINAEYNKLRDAFAASSGHKHDGSTGEGGYIPLIGDVDALNKVVIDTSNNRVGVFVEVSSAAVEQVRFQDGVIVPVTTNDIDLGSSSAKFKDLHLQGTATIATVDVNAGNIDGTILGASSPTTATFTSATLNNNLTVTGTSTLVGTTTITSVDLNSGAIDNAVIGSATPVAGTFTTLNANTSLVAATADINGGTLDGATVGASVPSTGAFTTLTASGTSTLTTVDINGGNIDGTVIGASTAATGSFTTLSTSGQATLATADINGGSIDGSTIGASSASTGAFTTLTSSGGITGNVTGNLTGNVTGNVTGDVTGNVTGNLTGNVTAGSGTSTFTNVTIDGTLNMNAGTSATIQNLTAPTNDLDAATKKYVDDEISTLIGDAGAGLDTLGELADALNDDDDFSTTVTNSIATKLPKAGGTMTGAIAMSTNKITGAGDPTSAQDVATKAYTDAQRDTRVAKTGDTMSGALAMGNNKITGLATPTAGTDVTNKTYVDGILGSATVAATSATNAATSETNAASSATAASNSASSASTSATNAAASYDNFDDRYLGAKSSAPTVDNDGDALITGALYFNSTTNIMNVYGSGGWQSAGSAVNGTSERTTYTATAGQTVFAATYDTGYIDVYLNGVKLLSGTDFTATNGTSITLASGASVNDVVDIVAYGTFELADHYTRTASDARYVQPTHTGNLNITGTVTSDGLTVDGVTSSFDTTPSTSGLQLHFETDTGLGSIGSYVSGGAGLGFYTNTGTDPLKQRIKISGGGDISFYEDTGTTAKFFWDASAESLDLGTTSSVGSYPAALEIAGSTGGGRPINTKVDVTTSANHLTFHDSSGQIAALGSNGGDMFLSGANLGIGTNNPTNLMHLKDEGYQLKLEDTSSGNTGEILVSDTSLYFFSDRSNSKASSDIRFSVDGSERLRIDSSGNLLVGTTDDVVWNNSANSAADNGHNLRDDGRAGFAFYSATANANATVNINRTGSDGDLIRLFKSGTKVGSIRSEGGDIVFGNDTRGLKFRDSDVIPRDMDNTTADGVVSLGSSTSRFKDLYLSGFTRYNTEVYVGDGASISGSYAANDLLLHTDNNPIVFRPNGTEAVRIDSSGNVGIGTSSPSRRLHVKNTGDSFVATFEGATNSYTSWVNTSGTAGYIGSANGLGSGGVGDLAVRSEASLIFLTNAGSERMRIDSSGNLLVGQTTASSNTVGTSLRPDGRNFYCANNNYSAHFNRKSSDGAIAHFAKDDTIAGSIGVLNSNNLTISGTVADHGGLQFGTHCVIPMEANVDSDGTVDLGSSNSKFKDGYFSGSLYGDGSNLTGVGGSTALGAVGTYAFIRNNHSNASPGDTRSFGTFYKWAHSNGGFVSSPVTSGTWRCMGKGDANFATLWVRIS